MRKFLLATTSMLAGLAFTVGVAQADNATGYGNSGTLFVTGSGDLRADNRIVGGNLSNTGAINNSQDSVAAGASNVQVGDNDGPVFVGVENPGASFDTSRAAGNRTALDQSTGGGVSATNLLGSDNQPAGVFDNDQSATAIGNEGVVDLLNKGRIRAGSDDVRATAEGNSSRVNQTLGGTTIDAGNVIEALPIGPGDLNDNEQTATAYGNSAFQTAVNRAAVTAEGRELQSPRVPDATAKGNDLDATQVNRANVSATNRISGTPTFDEEAGRGFRANGNTQSASAFGNVAVQDADNRAYIGASSYIDATSNVARIAATGNELRAVQTNRGDQTARNVIEVTSSSQANTNEQSAVTVGNSASQTGLNRAPVFAGPDNNPGGEDGSYAIGNSLIGNQVNTGDQRSVNVLDVSQVGNLNQESSQTALAFGNELIQSGTNRSAVTSDDGPLAIGNSLSGSQVNNGAQQALNIVRGGIETSEISQSATAIGSSGSQTMTNSRSVSVIE